MVMEHAAPRPTSEVGMSTPPRGTGAAMREIGSTRRRRRSSFGVEAPEDDAGSAATSAGPASTARTGQAEGAVVAATATVDLLSVIRKGDRAGWVPLTLAPGRAPSTCDWDGAKPAVRVACTLFAAPTSAYPHMCDGVAPIPAVSGSQADVSAEAPAEAGKGHGRWRVRDNEDDDVADIDIASAFMALDLDGNGVISRAELRHMLICMGELVTEGEIDEMMAMMVAPGSGATDAIGFYTFYAMAKAMNPTNGRFAKPDYVASVKRDVELGIVAVPPELAAKIGGAGRDAAGASGVRWVRIRSEGRGKWVAVLRKCHPLPPRDCAVDLMWMWQPCERSARRPAAPSPRWPMLLWPGCEPCGSGREWRPW